MHAPRQMSAPGSGRQRYLDELRPFAWRWRISESLQTPRNASHMTCKWISNCLRNCSCGFRVNSQESEIGRFWAKSLGYSPWFWTERILVSAGNRSRLPETPSPTLLQNNGFLAACAIISEDFRRIRKALKSADFEQKAWASPWFWRLRILVSAGNRSKPPETPPTCLQMDF